MSELIPVYEAYIQTLSDGRLRVLTLQPTKHHVESLHGSRGYYEPNRPVGFITATDGETDE
jgi:hypothetical protein